MLHCLSSTCLNTCGKQLNALNVVLFSQLSGTRWNCTCLKVNKIYHCFLQVHANTIPRNIRIALVGIHFIHFNSFMKEVPII